MGALVIALFTGTAISEREPQAYVDADGASGVSRMAAESASRSGCFYDRRGLAYYRTVVDMWRQKMGAGPEKIASQGRSGPGEPCPRIHVLAKRWKQKAIAHRRAYERWVEYHYDWPTWLPAKWQRIGACETGYGRRPGNWRHSNSSYEGAFGFAKSSWDAFKRYADRRAGPYPEDAWQATPRQQYEVALAIWRAYGFSGWGCRGA